MDWLKKHYDQFALAFLATALLASSAVLLLRARNFGGSFSAAEAAPFQRNNVPAVSLERIDKAKAVLQNPPQWAEMESHDDKPGSKKRGSLFVSDPYVIGEKGVPMKPIAEATYADNFTGQKIPNRWFMSHHLPLEPNVVAQDPDKDGFTNDDEWRGLDSAAPATHSTDPNNKESHPPYYSKLFVRELIRVPLRLLFQAYNGDPKKPETMELQINKVGGRSSEFPKMGGNVSKTPFVLKKFEFKTQLNKSTGEQEDVSELTLLNTETDLTVVLVLNRVADSPDFFMKFVYKWPNPPLEFTVKKLGEFVLKPNVTEKYKLIDSSEDKALIQLPDGKQVEITRDPREKKK